MVTNQPDGVEQDRMDLLFRALAHNTRRRILDVLRDEPGSRVCDVAARFGTSRIAVMKHLAVLEEAHLVLSERIGRERRLYLNAAPIQRLHERWISEFAGLFAGAALDLKRRIEARPIEADPIDVQETIDV